MSQLRSPHAEVGPAGRAPGGGVESVGPAVALGYIDKVEFDGIASSIGFADDAYGNVLMETINKFYKTECIRMTVFRDGSYKTIEDVEFAITSWVDWCNTHRLQSGPD